MERATILPRRTCSRGYLEHIQTDPTSFDDACVWLHNHNTELKTLIRLLKKYPQLAKDRIISSLGNVMTPLYTQ